MQSDLEESLRSLEDSGIGGTVKKLKKLSHHGSESPINELERLKVVSKNVTLSQIWQTETKNGSNFLDR